MFSVGPFTLEGPLGRGGMGRVWQARHDRGLRVAIKVLARRGSSDAVERFRGEVRALARLSHPRVSEVFDYGQLAGDLEDLPAGSPYFVMELAPGGSLRDALPLRQWSEVRQVLLSVLDACAHAHARGVIHRDIKPSNVLCDHGYKLADFGLAYALDGAGCEGSRGGTPAYMAPEQFEGRWREYGPWTDLYSIGCLAFELACGRRAFEGATFRALAQAHTHAAPPEMRALFPVPAGFADWVERLLRKRPIERFQRAADAAWELTRLGGVEQVGLRDAPASYEPSVTHSTAWHSALAWEDPPESTTAGQTDGPRWRSPVPPFPVTWTGPTAMSGWQRDLVGAGLGLFGWRSLPLVGRTAQRDAIWRDLESVVRARRARVVIVRGGAGIGKSRLVEWVCQRAHELGAATIVRATHGTGFGDGLAAAVADHLRCRGADWHDATKQANDALRSLGGDDEYLRRGVAEILAPCFRDASTEGRALFDSAAERFGLLRRLFGLFAQDRPMILWADDLHAGPETLGFLEDVAQAPDGLPLLALATVQDDEFVEDSELEARISSIGGTVLRLGPLPTEEQRELVQQLLGLEGELAARVEERTAGSPLFAVQLVGDWVARGVLDVGKQGFVLKSGERAEVPDDVHAMWAPRIAGFVGAASETYRALELAAIIGNEVDRNEWREACRHASLEARASELDPLILQRLFFPTASGWAFAHGMLRESLIRSAEENRRAALFHGAIADALTERYDVGRGEIAERIGTHLAGAARPAAALAPLIRGFRHRVARGDYRQGHVLSELHASALEEIRAEASDDRWGELWLCRSWLLRRQGRIDDAEELAQRSHDHAREHGWNRVLPHALAELGDVAMRRGETMQGLYHLQMALAEAGERGDEHDVVGRCSWTLGWVVLLKGQLDTAETLFEKSLQASSSGQVNALNRVHALWSLSHLHFEKRDLGTSREFAERAREESRRTGTRLGWAHATSSLAMVEAAEGTGRAEGFAREALVAFDEIGSAEGYRARCALALAFAGDGRFEEACEELGPAAEELGRSQRPGIEAVVRGLLLGFLALAGRHDALRTNLARYEELESRTGIVSNFVAGVLYRGADAARVHAPDLAASMGERARRIWSALGHVDDAKRAGAIASPSLDGGTT